MKKWIRIAGSREICPGDYKWMAHILLNANGDGLGWDGKAIYFTVATIPQQRLQACTKHETWIKFLKANTREES